MRATTCTKPVNTQQLFEHCLSEFHYFDCIYERGQHFIDSKCVKFYKYSNHKYFLKIEQFCEMCNHKLYKLCEMLFEPSCKCG